MLCVASDEAQSGLPLPACMQTPCMRCMPFGCSQVSALELAAVLLFLNAVRHLLVSYVVAIKRCNVLMSVLLGAALFRESIRSRLPYIFLMMLGVMLIVLEPSGFSITHSHNRLAD